MNAAASGKIQLVCRSSSGREIARQQFEPSEAQRADRIMVARNRAEIAAYRYNPDAAPRWGVETVTTEPATPEGVTP